MLVVVGGGMVRSPGGFSLLLSQLGPQPKNENIQAAETSKAMCSQCFQKSASIGTANVKNMMLFDFVVDCLVSSPGLSQ